MVWDAGFDGNNVINGISYSSNILAFMQTTTQTPTRTTTETSGSNRDAGMIALYLSMLIVVFTM